VAESRGGAEEKLKALEEQMKLFVDPVSQNATIENMVYELLLKSGKDLNSKIFPSGGVHIPVADVMNDMSDVMVMLHNHPALKGNSTGEGKPPRPTDTPPEEGNLEPDYFVVNDGEMVLMLKKATQEIVTSVLNEKPQKVIALDRLFKGNDQLKTNTALQMKDAGIEFKTI
jgi:adenine-specific DNA-methyltransferase